MYDGRDEKGSDRQCQEKDRSVRRNTGETENTEVQDKNGNKTETIIDGGYLDIGINDTMKDLIVNFIGAVTFSIIGLLYIKNKDEYKFAENFIPIMRKSKKANS